VTGEARLEETGAGLAPAAEGWFVVNVRDAAWVTTQALGSACQFEGAAARFAELGINIHVLQPGQPASLYHAEDQQEAFLVLAGECVLLVEGQQRTLRAWDFVHFAPGTAHAVVGAGDGPAVVFMVGARRPDFRVLYPDSDLARGHGAGAARETEDEEEAYAGHPPPAPGRPPGWERLPWA